MYKLIKHAANYNEIIRLEFFHRFFVLLLHFAGEWRPLALKGVHGIFQCDSNEYARSTLRKHAVRFHVTSRHLYINCSRCDWITGGDGDSGRSTILSTVLSASPPRLFYFLYWFVCLYVIFIVRIIVWQIWNVIHTIHIRFEFDGFFVSHGSAFAWPIDAQRVYDGLDLFSVFVPSRAHTKTVVSFSTAAKMPFFSIMKYACSSIVPNIVDLLLAERIEQIFT